MRDYSRFGSVVSMGILLGTSERLHDNVEDSQRYEIHRLAMRPSWSILRAFSIGVMRTPAATVALEEMNA